MKNKKILRKMAHLLVIALLITSAPSTAADAASVVNASGENTVVTSDSGTLDNGVNYSVSIKDTILTITVGTESIIFKTGNIQSTTSAVVVNSKSHLIHIKVLGGVYYVVDADNLSICIIAYKNASSVYCTEAEAKADAAYGGGEVHIRSIIDDTYFYRKLEGGLTSKEALMTRAEFDAIVNPVKPTAAPTQAPTAAPTQAPTAAPTQAPATAAPATAAPTQTPARTPDIEIDSHTEFNIEFWWNKYIEGVITWEQFTQITGNANWQIKTEYGESEITYYFYDDDGKLIRTEKITTGNEEKKGSGTVTVNEANAGKANVSITETGNGGAKGTIDTQTKVYVNNSKLLKSSTTKVVKTSSKASYARIRSGKYMNLVKIKNGSKGVICRVFWKGRGKKTKKGYIKFKGTTLKFDGNSYKHVVDMTYCDISKQILLLNNKGEVWIVPRAKGTVNKIYKPKKLAGRWKKISNGVTKMGLRVVKGKKCRGIRNAQPKTVKVKKK